MGRIGRAADYVGSRPTFVLLLIMLFAVVFRVSILFPSWAGGLPSGFDTYLHSGSAYFIAKGGLEASPASPIYPPIFLLLLTYLYQLTGIAPIYLVVPIGITIDVLCVPPMFYICKKISGNNETIGFLGAFFSAINPISIVMLIIGSFPEMLASLFVLIIISILVSSLRDRPAGIILMGLLGAFIFLTNILVTAFYVFFFILIFFYEVVFKRRSDYFKPLFLSFVIAVLPAGIYYIPRMSYFYVGLLSGVEFVLWVLPPLVVTIILLPPLYVLFKPGLRKKYIPARAQHLRLLEIWYLTTPIMALVFVWQVAVLARLWHFITFPAIVVLAIVFVTKFKLIKKAGKPEAAKVMAAALLVTCVVSSYASGLYSFNQYYNLSPDRLQLINWIEAKTPTSAAFCAEEEFLPTHLGWYIMGLTGRMSYESILNFSGPFQVGTDVTLRIRLANNITVLEANSSYWIQAVRDLGVSFVILLAARNHTNYAPIFDKVVFVNSQYTVYNVSQYAA